MQCCRMCNQPRYTRCEHMQYARCDMLISCLDDNKTKIAKSGALVPLTRLARSKDMRVQRNATGALLNMTHSGKNHVPSE